MSLSPYGCNYIFLLSSVPFFSEKGVMSSLLMYYKYYFINNIMYYFFNILDNLLIYILVVSIIFNSFINKKNDIIITYTYNYYNINIHERYL
jgi:hypothetical protein